MIEQRVFTVEEADRLIPTLSGLIERLRDERDGIDRKEVEIDALELTCGEESEGGANSLNRELEVLNELIAGFNATVEEIHSHGCYLKDIDLGLIDFYSLWDGKVVFLCWKYGEEEIRFWHEVGEGYASRQVLRRSGC